MLAFGADMDVFLVQFMNCVRSIVVKSNVEAGKYETLEIKRKADKYVEAMLGMTEWASFMHFSREVLIEAGIDSSVVAEMQGNKELIPWEYRDKVMDLQRRYVIDNYMEENNYYRMLHGEPTVEELQKSDFAYLPTNKLGIDTSTPIHMLTNNERERILNSTMYDGLLEKYPEKKWLKHIGSRAIDYHIARNAQNWEILHMDKTPILAIGNAFFTYYQAARDYVMRGLYTNEDRKTFNSYDGFMGFVILTMAINRTFASIFQQGITRDFYDDSLIRTLFDCYNIPYDEGIDVRYQREIAKKLNVLLQKKSSNNVIFDITGLFNYNSVNIYKYYLMKDYHKDLHGDPMIQYKTIVDEEGNAHEIIDPQATYDIYFQKVNIKSKDPSAELADPANRVEYESITGDDPYWIEDSDLLNKIYQTKFNTIITKYMSIDVMFDITKMMYQSAHAFRLIFDRYPETRNINITLPYVEERVSLYDAIVFLCALVAKKFGLTGEIPLTPEQIGSVYGVNFKNAMSTIRADINRQIAASSITFPESTQEIIDYITKENLDTVADVKNLSIKAQTLREFLNAAMEAEDESSDAYPYYKRISDALAVLEEQLITTEGVELDDTFNIFDERVARVYGFNFYADLDAIREQVAENIESQTGPFWRVDPKVLQYMTYRDINTIDDVRKIYENIDALRIFLDTAMRDTQDMYAYIAYRKLYNILLVTTDIAGVYTKSDGIPARTYSELLEDRRPDLKAILDETETGEAVIDEGETIPEIIGNASINQKINKVLDEMSDISEELENLRFINEKSEIVTNIEKVVNLMKSYTVDQVAGSVLYLINDPHLSMLKLVDTLGKLDQEEGFPNKDSALYLDDMLRVAKLIIRTDMLHLDDQSALRIEFLVLFKDILRFIHKVQMSTSMEFKNVVDLLDFFADTMKDIQLKDTLPLGNHDWSATVETNRFDYLHLAHRLEVLQKEMQANDGIHTLDYLVTEIEPLYHYAKIKFSHDVLWWFTQLYKENIHFIHKLIYGDSYEEAKDVAYIYDWMDMFFVTEQHKDSMKLDLFLKDIQRVIPGIDHMIFKYRFEMIHQSSETKNAISTADFTTSDVAFNLPNKSVDGNCSLKLKDRLQITYERNE